MNAVVNTILDNDNDLVNRVIALGPGDGINRMRVVVENASSISQYGLREGTEEFPEAVDYADLQSKAQDYLSSASVPTQEVRLTYFFEAGIVDDPLTYQGAVVTYNDEDVTVLTPGDGYNLKRGDEIRVAIQDFDGEDYGQVFTGRIEELNWNPGSVDILLGQPAYNLVDAINGAEIEEERKREALGLAVPLGVQAYQINPGVALKVNPYTNTNAVGVEIYASDSGPGFVVDRGTLLSRSPGTQFEFPELASGVTFYFKVRSYDNAGAVSEFADTVSAVSGFVTGSQIEGGSLDITKFADDINPVQVVQALPDLDVTPDYSIGDVIVNAGESPARLYVLVDTTGDPNTDWKLAVDAAGIDGQINETQIEDNAISTPKLAANAVQANNIAANAVEAGKIAVDAVTAGTIAAGAVNTDELAANSISTEKIKVGAVVGDQIVLNADTSVDVDAGSAFTLDAEQVLLNAGEPGEVNAQVALDNGQITLTGDTTVNGDFEVAGGNINVSSDNSTINVNNQVKLGYINGEAGVPSGVDYGLWGQVGSGVYIQGLPRVVGQSGASVAVNISYSGFFPQNSTIFHGVDSFYYARISEPLPLNGSTSFTVPEGKAYIAVVSRIYSPSGAVNVYGENSSDNYQSSEAIVEADLINMECRGPQAPSGTNNNGWATQAMIFPCGTYSNLRLSGIIRGPLNTDLEIPISANVTFLEIDYEPYGISGGDNVYISGGYKVHEFFNTQSFTINGPSFFGNGLLIGGGAGANAYQGLGGGGAGGYVQKENFVITGNSPGFVSIGSGGSGATALEVANASNGVASNGGTTSLNISGQRPAGLFAADGGRAAWASGIGGCGSGGRTSSSEVESRDGQGREGGLASTGFNSTVAGGGGGTFQTGANGTFSYRGGDGVALDGIFGGTASVLPVNRIGGGGGGYPDGPGGDGGGGDGAPSSFTSGQNGTDGLGGGGGSGGTGLGGGSHRGGDGGDGYAAIWYPYGGL